MYIIPYEKLTDEQRDAWQNVQTELASLPTETGDGAGWMFHGTDHLSSTYILEHGFRYHFNPSEDPRRTWAYFGGLDTAVFFAEKRMEPDSPPVILAVKTSDLIAAGIEADPNYDDHAHSDWREYVARGGTVRIRGGTVLPSLVRFDLGQLPLHPNATEKRAERQHNKHRFYGRCMPHPSEMPHLVDLVIEEERPRYAHGIG